jgi:hypothetical protein
MPDAPTYRCPFCERDARVGKPCPGCVGKQAKTRGSGGSARRTTKRKSWESSELFDENFDYEDFCRREFGKFPHHRTGLRWYWWWLAVIVFGGVTAAALWIR